MTVEKTEDGERLIFQSDYGNRDEIIIWSLAGAAACSLIFIGIAEDGFHGFTWVAIIMNLVVWINPLLIWLATGKTIIMTREGCTVLFRRYRKHYRWEELSVKRYVKGAGQLDEGLGRCIPPNYREGVVFSKHKAKPVRWTEPYSRAKSSGWMRPYSYCVYVRPLTSFSVNFYPLGVKEGHGDFKSQIENYRKRTGKESFFIPIGVTRKQEVYPADKFEFLNYMRLWQIDIEGLSESDTLLYMEEQR